LIIFSTVDPWGKHVTAEATRSGWIFPLLNFKSPRKNRNWNTHPHTHTHVHTAKVITQKHI